MLNKLLPHCPWRIGIISWKKGFFLSFVLGFAVRLIPEVLSYPYPIGFDSVYYAATIKSGVALNLLTSTLSMFLLDAILTSIYKVAQIDPFLLLKLTTPVLYALNVCGIYYFSTRNLGWNVKAGLFAMFLFSFQLASLRLSWDLYRNLLAMAILLFTLPLIQNIKAKRNAALFTLLSVLVVLTHILVSVMLFVVILSFMIDDWKKGDKRTHLKVLLAAVPAMILFFTSVYLFPVTFDMRRNVIDAQDTVHSSFGRFFFIVNYLGASDSAQFYPTYLSLASHVLSLFGVLYVLLLPLIFVGFFRNKVLDSWTLLLLFGSFNSLVTPFFALDLWSRWMFMLVYPFTFYAVNGIIKVLESPSKNLRPEFKWVRWMRVSKRKILAISFSIVFLGSMLLAVPPFLDRFGVFSIPTTNSYLPSTMLYNTVPLRDVRGTIEVMGWLNGHMNQSSTVILHYAFLWWANLYLNENEFIVYFVRDVEKALRVSLDHGFDPVYMVWWNEDYFAWMNVSIGWYGVTVPNHFISVFRSDRISVFKYSLVHDGE